jgi:beta-glucosidase
VEQKKTVLAHAEILAMEAAAAAIGDWRLEGFTIYVTKEPCAMCAGAMVNARVSRVVFGLHDPRSGCAGGAVDMSEWIDCVKGVVFVGFAGEGVNEAVCSVLTGETCPSGKLSETFPICLEDTYCDTARGNGMVERYDDGIFVGYRYYDEYGIDVAFPFGHGLSYAKFEYSNLRIEQKGDTDFEVSYDIKNISDVDGKEVSQVYVKDVFCMVSRPEKELKGFSKDLIKAGETKRVKIGLNFRSFAYYSTPLKKWHVENGWFEIYVGASSRDLPLKGKIKIELPDEEQMTTREI